MAITTNGAAGTTLAVSADLALAISDESGTGVVVFATSPSLTTPALGTPSALVLTNATGTPTSITLTNGTALPVSGITASTSTALGVGSVELGHATDTTLARSSAGVITVEGVVVPTISSTNTLTNKLLSDSTTSIVDVSDATKVVKFDVGGTTAITGTIATAFTTAKTLTLPDATDTLVGKATTDTFTNKTLTSPVISAGTLADAIVKGLNEDINIVAAAATGTINFEITTASIWYYTTNATANHTLNFRYSSTVSLNTFMAVGDSLTVVWLNTNGATAYYPSAFQIDGSSVTPKVPAAITAGNASSIDAYSFTIIKTASATFTVLETQTKFA